MPLYILDENVQTKTIEKLAKGNAEFILLKTIKEAILRFREETLAKRIHELEEKGVLWERDDSSSLIRNQEDRLLAVCNELNSFYSVILLSNDLLLKTKAERSGISVKNCG